MADISVVIDKLHSFETADDLALFLEGYGIKAIPRRSKYCAITKFVMEETGLDYVSTTRGDITVKSYPRYWNTDAMAEFVENYDNDKYPELIEESCRFRYTEDGEKYYLVGSDSTK